MIEHIKKLDKLIFDIYKQEYDKNINMCTCDGGNCDCNSQCICNSRCACNTQRTFNELEGDIYYQKLYRTLNKAM